MTQERRETVAELSGYIPREVKIEFKKACVAANRTMSDVLTEIIQNWIVSGGQK